MIKFKSFLTHHKYHSLDHLVTAGAWFYSMKLKRWKQTEQLLVHVPSYLSGTIQNNQAKSSTTIPNLKRSNDFTQIIVDFDDLFCVSFFSQSYYDECLDLRSFCNLFIIRLSDLKLTYRKTICNMVNALLKRSFYFSW